MIVSENIKLNIKQPFDDEIIENALREKGITPLRWAVISVDGPELTLCVSYIK